MEKKIHNTSGSTSTASWRKKEKGSILWDLIGVVGWGVFGSSTMKDSPTFTNGPNTEEGTVGPVRLVLYNQQQPCHIGSFQTYIYCIAH